MILLEYMNVIKPMPSSKQAKLNSIDFLLEGFWVVSYEDNSYYGVELGQLIGMFKC